jgi:hypothetical protein
MQTNEILPQLRTDGQRVDFTHQDREVFVRYSRISRRFEIDARTEDGWLRPIFQYSALQAAAVVESILATGEPS